MRLCFAILMLTTGCATGRVASSSYTLRQFLSVRRSNSATLSPDGTRIGFATNATGMWQAWIATIAGGAARQLTRLPSGVAGLQWSPTSSDLVVVSDHDGDQNYQLYLAHGDGGVSPLTQAPDVHYDFGGWSADGRELFYASNERDRRFFDCYLMEVGTREQRLVLRRDAVLQAAALSQDGRLLAAVERTSEADQNVFVVDTTQGQPRGVTPHDGPARFRVLGFAPGGGQLFVVSDLGREYLGVGVIDLATNKLRFLEPDTRDTDYAILSRDGRRLALSHNDDGYETLSVLDTSSGEPLPLPALPRAIVVPGELSADGRSLAVVITTPTHDDDIFLIDLERQTLTRVTHSDQAGLTESDLVTPSLVHVRARDGLQIPAFFYVPRRAHGPMPVIVSIHGGPEDQEQPWFWAIYQYFLSRGYAVLAPNIRGSTGRGKRYLSLDDGPRRWDALADVDAVVEWVKAQPNVDGKHIIGFGPSYGGFIVLAMLAHHPSTFAAGVDFYGPSDLATFLGRTAEYRRGQRAAEYGDPVKDAAFLAEISPMGHADAIRVPLFIAQGGQDPIVPPAESEQLVERLRARGVVVRYLLIPDEGHGFAKETNQIRAFEEMVAFLDSLWSAP